VSVLDPEVTVVLAELSDEEGTVDEEALGGAAGASLDVVAVEGVLVSADVVEVL
jgi:hypothetical protein